MNDQATSMESPLAQKRIAVSGTIKLDTAELIHEADPMRSDTRRMTEGFYPVGLSAQDLVADYNEILDGAGIALGIALRSRERGDLARYTRWMYISDELSALLPALD